MSLNTRILLSFALMAIIVAVIALLGVSGNTASTQTLKEVVALDLPAEKELGLVSRYFEAAVGEQNYLLNPNLSEAEHQAAHARYAEIRAALLKALDQFGKDADQLGQGQGDEIQAFNATWKATHQAVRDWIKTNDQVFELYKAWEATYILSPNFLWGSLQQYRGDHYILIRRLAEMLTKGQVSGPEVTPADNLCNFGKWRISFDGGHELFAKNPTMNKAMHDITGPHREFHAAAAELYNLIKSGQAASSRAQDVFYQVLGKADQVVGGFSSMIEETAKSQKIYREAADLSQGLLEEQRVKSVDLLNQLAEVKTRFDDWDKGLVIAEGEKGLLIMEWGTGLALFLSVGLAAFVALSIKRRLTGPLNRVIDSLSVDATELSSVAGQLSQTSAALSQGSGEQAASLEESSAAIEEMSSMTSRNAESSKRANGLMTENSAQVKEGFETVGQMTAAMEAINQSSEEIGRIIKTIEDIAFQTNILALNAAVEAARAGEAGQGFAVVADEVRNLAQRSAQASQDTRSLIEDTVRRVATGRALTKTIEDFFAHLTQSTQEAGHMIHDIDEATNEQAQGMTQISQSVAMIDKVAGETLQNAQNAASASEALSSRAVNLAEAVEDLGRIIGRPANGPHAKRPAEKSNGRKRLPM